MTGRIADLLTVHAEAYRALRLASLDSDPDRFSIAPQDLHEEERWWERHLERGPEDLALGAFDGDTLVGFVFFRRDRRLRARHRGLLHGLFVADGQRGHGLGRALVERVLEHAATLDGLEYVEAWVLGDGPRDFYVELGFRDHYTIERDMIGPNGAVDATYLRHGLGRRDG